MTGTPCRRAIGALDHVQPFGHDHVTLGDDVLEPVLVGIGEHPELPGQIGDDRIDTL